MDYDKKKKKLYDETVSLIADLGFRNRISFDEMNFLLTLLDLIFINKAEKDLITTLKKWVQTNNNSEIDEIIKATLLATDLRVPEAQAKCMEAVLELLEARS